MMEVEEGRSTKMVEEKTAAAAAMPRHARVVTISFTRLKNMAMAAR